MKVSLKTKLRTMMWVTLGVLLLLVIATAVFINQPKFGKAPAGARLERIKKSPNYRNGAFQNQSPTPNFSSDKNLFSVLYDFLFKKVANRRPSKDIPSVKTDLSQLGAQDAVVWMGHSALFLQLSGIRFLVDPALVSAAPLAAFNKAFAGTSQYQPQDLPAVDYLLLTHDHWDHLDYHTVLQIKDRVGAMICPLGVGAHLEYWGVDPAKIIELDWNEQTALTGGFTLTALPARHFSGRGFKRNQSLWASFMLTSASGNVYIGGDSGYDTHFASIQQRFGDIDLAILENGQYNTDWRYIHLTPEDLVRAVKDLRPKRLLTVHHSKYALAMHAWYEPLEQISAAARKDSLELLTPMIGEPIRLQDSTQTFTHWWTPYL